MLVISGTSEGRKGWSPPPYFLNVNLNLPNLSILFKIVSHTETLSIHLTHIYFSVIEIRNFISAVWPKYYSGVHWIDKPDHQIDSNRISNDSFNYCLNYSNPPRSNNSASRRVIVYDLVERLTTSWRHSVIVASFVFRPKSDRKRFFFRFPLKISLF